MINAVIRRTILVCAGCLSLAGAQTAIVISDGPSHSNSSIAQKIVVSDGPAGAIKSGSQIVITDGPTVLPYHYPPDIVITSGPSQLPYRYAGGKVVVSDGPGSAKELPEPETSTLAPP